MLNIGHIDLLFGDLKPSLGCTLHTEDAQVFFEFADEVWFQGSDGRKVTGHVAKMNPKRANVQVDSGRHWLVPYALLHHVSESTEERRAPRADRLKEVAVEARDLMNRHGLEEWTLRFSVARRRLGACRSGDRVILLARHHAVNDRPEQVTDTILHEIAHALAGPEAGHGPAWKAIAHRIGAIPKARGYDSDLSGHHNTAAREQFRVGDTVSFIDREQRWKGTIVRMNPRRAVVDCGYGVWRVHYASLKAAGCPGSDSGNYRGSHLSEDSRYSG